ncbi:Glyoxalase-like domain protein [Microbacterium oxydans]|uniref:Glyoxalase-like domain protein n=1 Tax=Microbacterium oxydans TaxID=82380 RepID=A0A0F0KME7_9MICO|nr:VOC family protein [Microbacterium oxydans]KJL20426.1 Glyoxalase-like domain protein [Microbacterium oxydans]
MASLVTALDHLQLSVARLDEAVAWYTDVLGFRLLTNYGAYAMLRLEPGLDVMLWEAVDHTPVQVAVDGETKPIFFLKTESFDQLAARLEQEQVRVAGIEDLGFARFLKFYDPSDNFLGAIEFAQDPSAA